MTELEAQGIVTAAIAAVTKNKLRSDRWDGSCSIRDLGVTSLMLFDFVSELERLGEFVFRDLDIDLENFRTPDSVMALLGSYPLSSRSKQA